MEQGRQFRQFFSGARSVNFHAAVIEIARVSGETQRRRGALREVAISHTLHTSANVPAPGFQVLSCHSLVRIPLLLAHFQLHRTRYGVHFGLVVFVRARGEGVRANRILGPQPETQRHGRPRR